MPGSGGKAKVEACIWAGSKWQSREMPKPKSNKVYFQMMKKIRVYVR